MIGSGFPGDFLDSVIKFLDFPLENVEEGCPGDGCHDDHGGFEELQTMPPNVGLFGSFSSNVCGVSGGVRSELPSSYHPIPYNNGSQLLVPSNSPQGMSRISIAPKVPPSNVEAPTACQISSPASVLDTNRCCTSTFDQLRAPQTCSSSSASEKYFPLEASISISKLTGDIGSYHLPANPTRKLCPSTFDQQHVSQSISSSSASGKINPLGTNVSISKLTGDMGSYRFLAVPQSKRSRVRKTKRKKPSLLFGSTDGEKNSQKPVATRSKTWPEKLLQKPVSFGSMDGGKISSQKPLATRTEIMQSKLLPNPVTAKKCVHCGATKTPQWRSGPTGKKSLCNACGVRYRLGRLFPEYRPAASPTFVASLHSNTHRMVMKIRDKSCNEEGAEAGAGAATSLPPG